jgi:hypothetical protein
VLNASEPKMIRFEIKSVPEILVPSPSEGVSRNAVASFRRYMSNPRNYESFFVYQTPNGYFQATKHEHWNGRIDASKVGIDDGKKRPFVVKPQMFR